jgi:hypothetical protein
MNPDESKNIVLLDDFAVYCAAHPDEWFWQALWNWSGCGLIFAAGGEQGECRDLPGNRSAVRRQECRRGTLESVRYDKVGAGLRTDCGPLYHSERNGVNCYCPRFYGYAYRRLG